MSLSEEALSALDRVNLFAVQNEEDGSLEHAIKVSLTWLKPLLFAQRSKGKF